LPKINRVPTEPDNRKEYDQYDWYFIQLRDPDPGTFWERRWRNIKAGRDQPGVFPTRGPTMGSPRKRRVVETIKRWWRK